MSDIRELSFCELKQKDIVCVNDGRKLGKIVDLVFMPSGKVKGIVAPYGRKFLFFRSQEVYIPYCNIKTIGEDIILVDVDLGVNSRSCKPSRYEDERECENNPKDKSNCHQNKPSECDGRCDKCMLFDCESRWRKRCDVYVDNAPYK